MHHAQVMGSRTPGALAALCDLVTTMSEVRGGRPSLLSKTFLHMIDQPLCLTASTPLSSMARGKAALTNVKFEPRKMPISIAIFRGLCYRHEMPVLIVLHRSH
jgi:hypothetical protein